MKTSLTRFLEAQTSSYPAALAEIKNGRKRSHWMWFIFPQIQGLGLSETARFYAIQDLREAEEYARHPVLGARLVEISTALLGLKSNDAHAIMGSPDDLKLKSSMTLFAAVPGADPVFQAVLAKFFGGAQDEKTMRIIGQNR
ncbi:DUF1810 domain-containing protein [Hymenobacter sp. DH14]|uniref:DUF1810 domain-containing protein n=1 Tax=Hymenobacter cyanobacteriorum TaxID=2926463 RepID=A0A9X1VBC3_9BACT|nr:DUF1810 domain-containing protein [Hymenobacter cyanobacteriorum]MCI1185959.1 DUF1810 domain-containing protein [Hymenobacter cyanobacteriorum]